MSEKRQSTSDDPVDGRRDASDGTSGLRDGSNGSGADELLCEALELGRSALDCTAGALVRVTDDGWAVHTAVSRDDGDRRPLSEHRVRAAVCGPDPIVEADSSDGGAPGWFVGQRVTVDGEPFGVVCFTDERATDRDHPTGRAVAGLVGRLVAALLEETGGDPGWSDRALTETLLKTIPDVLYAFSVDGQIVQWNDELERVTGYDASEIATMGPLDFVAADDRARVAGAIGERDPAGPEAIEADLVTHDGERIPYELNGAPITDKEGEVVGFAGVGRDVSDLRSHEQTLTALHNVTRELLPLESEGAICERVVEAATELLDIAVVGAFLFDDERNVLEPVAQNAAADEVVDKVPTFRPGEGIAWEAFMRGEVAVFDDVRAADAVYNPETEVRSELFVPMGEHGILLAASTTVGAFDDQTAELADLLAANAEAALDNVARKRELAERDAALARQHSRLKRLNEINDRVRRIGHALVGADTTEEIARVVCERLSAVEEFALVAYLDGDRDEELTARAVGGRGEGYFEAVDVAAADAAEETQADPTRRAARTRDPVVVDRVASDFQGEPWRRAALSRDFRSVAAFPLTHDGVPHGVLAVCADTPGAFDEETVTVLGELADMVAETVGVAQRQRAARADDPIELVVELDPWPDPLGSLADRFGAETTVSRAIPQVDDTCLLYGETGADRDRTREAIASTPGVSDGRVVAATDEMTRFEVTTMNRTVPEHVHAVGGTCRAVELADGTARLVARLPPSADVRGLVERIGDAVDGDASVLAQRTSPTVADADPMDVLTERQRAALLAAYDAGFFEWPRASDGETVAGDLSVSQPTFAEHLRRAQANLFGALFDE